MTYHTITWHHITLQKLRRMPKGPLCFVHFLTFQSSKFAYWLGSIFSRAKTAWGSFCCMLSIETTRRFGEQKARNAIFPALQHCHLQSPWDLWKWFGSIAVPTVALWNIDSMHPRSGNRKQQNLQDILLNCLYKKDAVFPIPTLPLVQSWEV